jgi:probable HAF family extracellular repeat protein
MSAQTIGLSRAVLISVITLAFQASRTDASPLYSVIDLGPASTPSAVPDSLSVVRFSNLSGQTVSTIPVWATGTGRPGEELPLGPISFYAALVTSNGVTTRIGDLGGDFEVSNAAAINNLGQAVGTAWKAGGTDPHGFLWSSGQTLDLEALLVGSPNVKIDKALNIDDEGRILAGGIIDGVEHSVLLIPQTIPEPGAIVAFSILAAWLGLRPGSLSSSLRKR